MRSGNLVISFPDLQQLQFLPEIEKKSQLRFKETVHSECAFGETLSADHFLTRYRENSLIISQISQKSEISIAGFLVFKKIPDNTETTLFIEEMSVLPEYAGNRIGEKMIQYMVSIRPEIKSIWLTTFENIPWNAPYYERLGFLQIPYKDCIPEIQNILHHESSKGLKNRIAMVKNIK